MENKIERHLIDYYLYTIEQLKNPREAYDYLKVTLMFNGSSTLYLALSNLKKALGSDGMKELLAEFKLDEWVQKNLTPQQIEAIEKEVESDLVQIKERRSRCERYRLRVNSQGNRKPKGNHKAYHR